MLWTCLRTEEVGAERGGVAGGSAGVAWRGEEAAAQVGRGARAAEAFGKERLACVNFDAAHDRGGTGSAAHARARRRE